MDLGDWHLRYGYTGCKMDQYLFPVSASNRLLLEVHSVLGPLGYNEMAFSTVVIIIKRYYDVHVRDVCKKYIQTSARQNNVSYVEFAWG